MRWHRHFGLGLSKTRGPLLEVNSDRREAALRARRNTFRVILGAPQRSAVVNQLRGNVIRDVSNSLPDEIDLLVYA
jgi:hypothetical protein